MHKWQRLIGATMLLTGVTIGAGAVGAGQVPPDPIGQIEIKVMVFGPEYTDIETDWVPELFVSGADEFDTVCPDAPGIGMIDGPLVAARFYDCPVYDETTFTFGFPTPPEPYEVTWSCAAGTLLEPEAFTDPSATFTISEATPYMSCDVTMSTGMVLLDKLFPADEDAVGVPGADPEGGADRGDFTLEVFDAAGPLAASGSDTDGERCSSFQDAVDGDCALLLVPPGDYELGEEPAFGYEMVETDCFGIGTPDDRTVERFPVTAATSLTIGDQPGDSVYCSITNQYREGSVTLTKTITNDNGGTATMGDFTLELYRAGGGTPVATGVCQASGVCLDGDYPIGDYVVGEIGPDGYTRTVTQEIVLPVEALTETEAAFTLVADAEVTVNVASNDNPPATTTTAAPTTVAPTTTAGPTTTAFDAGGATLPSTGTSSNTGTLTALALMLLVFGAAATALTRRPT